MTKGPAEVSVFNLRVFVLKGSSRISLIDDSNPGVGAFSVHFLENKFLTTVGITWIEDWIDGEFFPDMSVNVYKSNLVQSGLSAITHFGLVETAIRNMFGNDASYFSAVKESSARLSVLVMSDAWTILVNFLFKVRDLTSQDVVAETQSSIRFTIEERTEP